MGREKCLITFVKSPRQSSMHLKYFCNWDIALQEERYFKFHKLESSKARVLCSHSDEDDCQ